MLAIFGGIVALVAAMMTNAFDQTIQVKLVTDRAGLMMSPKNDVKLHGVAIGRVADVRLEGDRVAMTLKLDRDKAHLVPANARGEISPATAFGNKFITLAAPRGGAEGRVREGSVLETDRVGVEANTVLANLNKVLTTAKPSEWNTTLHAVAMSLQGKGDRLGDFLVDTGKYVDALNRELPTLRRDLRQAAQVANLYADAAPDFFHVLDNVTKVSGTVVEKQRALREFLTEAANAGAGGSQLFQENGQGLLDMLRLLEPTSALLGRYSPGLTCFIQGEANAVPALEKAMGAGGSPGARVLVNVLPGKAPYKYPDNVPQVETTGGPQCYGLPLNGNTKIQPKYDIPGAGHGDTTDPTPGGAGEPR